MKTLFWTIFYTKKGLILLDNEFEENLIRKALFIFGLFGSIQFILNFEFYSGKRNLFLNLFAFIITISLAVLIGMTLSYILFKTGKLLNGKSSYLEILALYAYSITPILIGLILIGFLAEFELSSIFFKLKIKTFIFYLSWIISLKIVFQGLLKFNGFSKKKAFLNLIILQIFIVGFFFLLPHIMLQ